MGIVRAALVGGAASSVLLVAACGGENAPAADVGTTPAAASASAGATDAPDPPDVSGSTDTERERTGAAGRVPRAAIIRVLRDSAERIAQRLAEKSPPTVVPTDVDPDSNRGLGYQSMLDFGFDAGQWRYLDALWQRESGWDHLAENPSSGAYGIPQSLPGSKMAVIASDWRTNPATQIQWGLAYISARYGDPQGAWAHSEQFGWY